MNLVAPLAPAVLLEVYGEANVRLGRIEAEEDITILYAVESGSRAWGFPSPDSDNDVRFFYVRPISEYVRIETARDVIERPIDGLWDVNGWDLRKALSLMVKGNATVAEWLASPLVYREHGPVPSKLRDLVKRYASPARSAAHYYGLTNTCYKGDIANKPTKEAIDAVEGHLSFKGITTVVYKKYLYALRGACAIAWIKRYEEIPPMSLPSLMSHDIIPDVARLAINRLLGAKATMGECGSGPRIAVLDKFIESELAWVQDKGFAKRTLNADLQAEADHLLLTALGVSI